MNIASYSIQTSLARTAWLESSLDWTVLSNIYSASFIVFMFYLFINKDFYTPQLSPDGCHPPKYNSVWTYIEFDIVLPSRFGFD